MPQCVRALGPHKLRYNESGSAVNGADIIFVLEFAGNVFLRGAIYCLAVNTPH